MGQEDSEDEEVAPPTVGTIPQILWAIVSFLSFQCCWIQELFFLFVLLQSSIKKIFVS